MDARVDPFAALDPAPFQRGAGHARLQEPPEALLALLLAGGARAAGSRGLLHVARSETRAERLARAARGFDPGIEALLVPPWDCAPYDRASPSPAVMGRRIAAFAALAAPARPRGRLVVTTVETLVQRLPPRAVWPTACLELSPGEAVDDVGVWLIRHGYVLDERVDEPGEAALRGEVIDIFPGAADEPVRIELADGRIARMRRYNPVDQRTTADVDLLILRPVSEAILGEEVVRRFLEGGDDGGEGVLDGPPERPRRISGLESRLPLFYERLETLFDSLPEASLSLDPEMDERIAAWLAQVDDDYRIRAALRRNGGDGAKAPFEPRHLYLDQAELREQLGRRPVVALNADGNGDGSNDLPRFLEAADAGAELARFVAARAEAGERIVLAAPDDAGRRRLARLVERRVGISPEALASWPAVRDLSAGAVATVELDVASGFALDGLVVIATKDVGIEPSQARGEVSAAADALFSAEELRPGDLVVHSEHGIARLLGLEQVEEGGGGAAPGEFLTLQYAGGRRLLVPVAEIDRVWRYGAGTAEVALDQLGGEAWQARTGEIEAQLETVARELVARAARRANAKGVPLQAPRAAARRFAARFRFTETDDQARAIAATLSDLARGSPPMDRLVCGDIGFGKTEVALRAACAAALCGRQVALVAPTTVLVRQHLETFRRRFAGFDVRVEQLSRLSRGAEARATRAGIADGSVRIAIGTHALASDGVRFADLGLVIIDEEQRFGARHKEQLRRLRGGVHVLTLTATPIPRTLQSALVGLTETSVIATPPVRRRPVRTFVAPFDPVTVREALRREARRGGQSFFVCPRIQDLQPMAEHFGRLLPDLDVAVAHGRMKGAELDELMVGFAGGRHDVLLTTDIVETGLDIPNANTMLVWRADRFGLAQLHQLRGRVGRGARQAYAYLLTDPDAALAPATEQRLRTLEAMEGLGAGFAIGARDLDLRGAGDLLGSEQAGHARVIGTGLYQRLVERALQRARGDAVADDRPVEVHVGVAEAIPEAYVPEPEVRIALYRRLAGLADAWAVADFAEEIADRFGPPPPGAEQLLELARLRQRCRAAGIALLEAGPKGIALTFNDPAGARRRIKVADHAELRWRDERLVWHSETETPEQRLQAAHALVGRIEAAQQHRAS